MKKCCWTCKFSSDNSEYPNCNSNPKSPTYNNIENCTVDNFWQPVKENKMKCRNDNCSRRACCDESGCDKLGLNNLYKCKIRKCLLPLWKFQDRWEDKTREGYEYEILKIIDGHAFGIIFKKDLNSVNSHHRWSISDGKSVCHSDCNLIPKSKQWYGLVNKNGKLLILCGKDANPQGFPEGCRIAKLKEDK